MGVVRPLDLKVGSDPEGFVSRGGKVIGAEKVVPKMGLKSGRAMKPHVVLDGVQFEMHPPAHNSVYALGSELSIAMELIGRAAKKAKADLDWRGTVEVDQAELDSLSDECRALGCQPSQNIYGEFPIKADPQTYRIRSAGGHMHFTTQGLKLHKDRPSVVAPIDILVGNLCVLIDRDPDVALRRENYGRAGEYRADNEKKPWGIEYRTLSNFWTRNYALMDLVFGMANFAISVVEQRFNGNDIEGELVEKVKIANFIEAINQNDFSLALYNFRSIRPFLAKYLPKTGFPLSPDTLDKFEVFVKGVKSKGLTHFFPEDPVTHWTKGKRVEFAVFLKEVY